MAEMTCVVAGNATSLATDKTGRVLATDTIIRVNNFFFEPVSYLGTRVDMAVMSGDPRVAPFMFETLWRQRHVYDLRAWTSHNAKVIKAGQRRFGHLFVPFPVHEDPARAALNTEVLNLITQYDCKPMTGTYAALCAYNLGATSIILTGFDFYQGTKRYAYEAGLWQTTLLGDDLNTRSVDTRQHNKDLDLAILNLIQNATQGAVSRISTGTLLDSFTDLAPLREGPGLDIGPTNAPKDWAPRAGLYPLAALRVMRRVKRTLNRAFGS